MILKREIRFVESQGHDKNRAGIDERVFHHPEEQDNATALDTVSLFVRAHAVSMERFCLAATHLSLRMPAPDDRTGRR